VTKFCSGPKWPTGNTGSEHSRIDGEGSGNRVAASDDSRANRALAIAKQPESHPRPEQIESEYVFEDQDGERYDEHFEEIFIGAKIRTVDVDGRPDHPIMTIYADNGWCMRIVMHDRENSIMFREYRESGKDATEGRATPPSAVRETNG
jgi:hypothetical protein